MAITKTLKKPNYKELIKLSKGITSEPTIGGNFKNKHYELNRINTVKTT